MNILQIGDVEVESTGDMLKDIFNMQDKLRQKYEVIEQKNGIPHGFRNPDGSVVNINTPINQHIIKDMAYRCITEIVEATECLKNKPWKQTHMHTDVEHMKEEIADALHFFIELCLLCGMSAEDLYSYYLKKNGVNGFRIRSNY